MMIPLLLGFLVFQGAPADDRLFPVNPAGGQWGYIDVEGRVVIEPQYREARRFSGGRGAVSVEGGTGFIDTAGKVVVPCVYWQVRPFSEGLASVMGADLQWGAVDPEGTVVIPLKYEFVGPCSDGLVRVRTKGKKEGPQFLDKKGNLALPALKNVQVAEDFSEGLACVDNGNYIDKKGKVVFRTNGLSKRFSEGLAAFTTSSGAGYYLDRTGKVVIGPPAKVEGGEIRLDTSTMKDCKFWGGGNFSCGLAVVKEASGGLHGYLNPKGQFEIPPRYVQAASFSEDRAFVEWRDQDGRSQRGIIDKTGQVVIPLEFGVQAEPFVGGLARLSNTTLTGKWIWRYVDRSGKIIWEAGSRK
ncbi:MAG TPA: WG repeat-containing protein [Planctomycetota bacterium]|nr:WG repeat-containing protein [Planctomycetota bacterium]